MNLLPQLSFSLRSREFKKYSDIECASMLYEYLFQGLSYRKIDTEILHFNQNDSEGWEKNTRGFQSKGTLAFLGITKEHKGLFKEQKLSDVLIEIKKNSQWQEIYNILVQIQYQKDEDKNLLVFNEDDNRYTAGEYEYITHSRKGQDYFRQAVLSAYEGKCCMTGMKINSLLEAAHIKPWNKSDNDHEKINPKNGLCLNVLHHKAFDQGYITIDTHYKIIVSDKLKENPIDKMTKEFIIKLDGEKILLPQRYTPNKEFIEYHNDVIFI